MKKYEAIQQLIDSGCIRALTVFSLCVSFLAGMPSYEDVLLIVKSGDAKSIEIGNYFKAARGLPSANVATLNITGTTGSVMTKNQRDTLVGDISSYIAANGLAGKINYIVLSAGIPVKAYDNAGGTKTCMLEMYIMYKLSAAYPASAWMTNNPYAYIRKSNYTNRSSIKFSRNKYGYYIVSRLDGPSTSAIKKMIDNSGAQAYDSYKKGVTYIVDAMYNPADEHHAMVKTNIESRGGTYSLWDNSQCFIHDMKDINFLDADWVRGATYNPQTPKYTRNSVIAHFPHQWKRLSFAPGSLMCVFRSFPTGNGYFSAFQYGLHSYLSGILTTNMKADGSDTLLHNMAGVAINEEDHTIWCAVSIPPFFDGVSPEDMINAEYLRRHGSGIAVYDKTGTMTANITKANTPGLLCDAVYTIAYDKYNHRMWIGTFSGVCYYDLALKTWTTPAGLSHYNGARVAQIYIDPTTLGRKVYVTYTAGNTGWRVPNQLASYQQVFEFDVPDNTVTIRNLGISDLFFSAHVIKTSPNILWVRYATNKNGVNFHYIRKVRLSDNALIYELAFDNIGGINYTPPQDVKICPMNLAADTSMGTVYIYSPIGTTNASAAIQNGVLRIADGAVPTATVWGSATAWKYTANNIAGTKVFQNPKHPDRIYVILRRFTMLPSAGGNVIEFSAANTTGTELKSGNTVLNNVNDAIFDEQIDGKLWFVRQQNMTGDNDQYPIYEFFNSGLTAAMGGFSHDTYYYDGIPYTAKAPASELISTALPDYHLYSPETHETQTTATLYQMKGIAMLLLDGFYLGEARFGSLPQYPVDGGGGFSGHLLVMDPKSAPYAPRVDFTSVNGRIERNSSGAYELRLKIFTPMEVTNNRGFIASSINTSTVRLYNVDASLITAESISSESGSDGKTEIRYTTRTPLVSGAQYMLSLQCGVDGIKNNSGASLVNTRAGEFSDIVALEYINTAPPDNTPPSSHIITPSDGTKLTAPGACAVSVNAVDHDGFIAKVEIFTNGKKVGEGTAVADRWTYMLSGLAEGTYTVTVKAYDNAGALATSSVTITVTGLPDLVIRNITMSPPVPGPGTNVIFSADVSNAGTAATPYTNLAVVFRIDGANLSYAASKTALAAGATTNISGSIPWAPSTVASWTAAAGIHAVDAFVDDYGPLTAPYFGRIAEANESNNKYTNIFTVNERPSVTIVSPVPGTSYTAPAAFVIHANASDRDGTVAKVEFHSNGVLIGEDVTAADGWTCSLSGASAGVSVLTAKAYDNGGASTVSPGVMITITASPALPDLVIRNITMSPPAPGPGTNVVFIAAVSNAGTAPTPYTNLAVVFRIDGANLSYAASKTTLAAGATTNISGSIPWAPSTAAWWTASAGIHAVDAFVDDYGPLTAPYFGRIAEANESNNKRTNEFTVSAPASGHPLYIEAESGMLTLPMKICVDDASASGGAYIMTPPVSNSIGAAPANGWASYTFTVPETGSYRIEGLVKAASGSDDSFWVKLGDGPWVNWNNIVSLIPADKMGAWNWVTVFNYTAGSSIMDYQLTAGVSYTLTFGYREDGTKLDRICIRKSGDTSPHAVPDNNAAVYIPQSTAYQMQPVAAVPEITGATAVLHAADNRLHIQYTINTSGVDIYELSYAICETGNNNWQPISPASLRGGVYSLSSVNGWNDWEVSGLSDGKTYSLGITATADKGASARYIIGNIDTGRLFSSHKSAAAATALNNPYRGGTEGIVFVNLPAGSSVSVYTVSGTQVAMLAATPENGRLVWDVRKSDGSRAAPGIYLCRIKSPAGEKTLKVVVQK